MPIRNGLIQPERHIEPDVVVISGSFKPGVVNVDASYTLAVASGTNITVTSDAAGTAGNALDFQATADGSNAATLNFATAGMTNMDGVLTFGTGGTGGNDWTVSMGAGSGLGVGVVLYEDPVNKTLNIIFEDGVSTQGDVTTAVSGTTNFTVVGGTAGATLDVTDDDLPATNLSGGTAETWAEESGTPSKTHLHFTDAASSVADAVSALNTLASGTKTMTASGSGAHTLASGDAVAKQDLSGGVDAVAIANKQGNFRDIWTVAQSATGTYTVTFADNFEGGELLFAKAGLRLNAGQAYWALCGAYSASNQTLGIWTVDSSGAADPTAHANNRVDFEVHFKNSAA